MNAALRAVDEVLRRVESAAALDRPAEALASIITSALPMGRPKDAASGTWLGHPLHPMLVTLPIGAWSGATVLDLTSMHQSAAARRLVGFGVLAALPAAVAGASDWVDTIGAERRVGLLHAAGAWLSIGLYAASWRARRSGFVRGKLLAMAGAGVLGATGYLGGHLTYAYGIGVDTTAFESGPQAWTDVASDADIAEGELKQCRVGDVAIVVTRWHGRLYALADRCSHRGGPLSEGTMQDGCVVCPWHSSAFSIEDGSVQRGPASIGQPSYEVRVSSGQVQARRAQEHAAT